MVVIVDDEILNRDFAAIALSAAGWRVATAADGHEAVTLLEQLPTLMLVDLHMAGMSGIDTAGAVRRSCTDAADAAILAYTTTPHGAHEPLHAHGFDGFVPKPCTADEIVREAARWVPRDAAPVLARLEGGLGADHIRSLTRRFRLLLIEALAALNGPSCCDIAHRVAGVAGTLGFAEAGAAWLALSEGNESARADARREARRAIMAIDLYLNR